MRLLCFALALSVLCAPAAAQLNPLDSLSEFLNPRTPSLPAEIIRYGETHEQRVKLIVPPGEGPYPLVVRLPGLGFSRHENTDSTRWISEMLYENGFAFAEVYGQPSYEVGAAAKATQAAMAIARLVQESGKRGIDANRIILFGSGSQAHFAALLATDPQYLRGAGVPFEAVRGAMMVNGEGFDIPTRIKDSSRFQAQLYKRVFGDEPAVHRELSPTSHLSPPNAPSFLLLVARHRHSFIDQAEGLAAALRGAGSQAEVWRLPRTFSEKPSTYIGNPRHPRTADLIELLRRMAGIDVG